MSGAAFLRVEKLKGGGIIAVASRHNKREIQAETGAAGSIDPTRSHLNFSLTGAATAGDVAQRAKDLMSAADLGKLRKDAVLGIEAVFSLPVGTLIDVRAYFADCLNWAATYFGGMANILAFDAHMDEAAPHAHALILPLVDGQMNGGRMVGARSKLLDMQSQFHYQVAKQYGLRKAPPKLKGEAKFRASARVLAYLRETGDTALQSLAWPNIRACIESDPVPFLLALGLVSEPVKPVKPFVDYVTSPGKGARFEREQWHAKSIDFQANDDGPNSIDFKMATFGKGEVYVSGDFVQPTPQEAPPTQPLSDIPDEHGEVAPPAHSQPTGDHEPTVSRYSETGQWLQPLVTPASEDDQTTVIRDGDQEAGQWCEELGEFSKASISASKASPRAARQAAERWVASALGNVSRPGMAHRMAEPDFERSDRVEVEAWL